MIFIILWGKSDCQNKGSALTQSHYLFKAITVLEFNQIPYARHHKPLLIRIRSWLEAAIEYKPYIRTEFFEKTSLKTKKNWNLEMG